MGNITHAIYADPGNADKVDVNIAWCESQGLDASNIAADGLTITERNGQLVLTGDGFVLDHAGRKALSDEGRYIKRPFGVLVTSLPPTAYTYSDS